MFIGEYQDIPRIYTAIAEWISCVLICMMLPRKVSKIKFGVCSGAVLLILSAWLILTDHVNLYLWFPCMAAAIGIMYGYLRIVLEGSNITVFYHTMKAFLAAEFAAAFEWQLEYFFVIANRESRFGWMILIGAFLAAFFVIYLLERRMNYQETSFSVGKKEALIVLLIVLLAFIGSNLSFVNQSNPFASRYVADIFLTRTMVDLVGLAILYSYQLQLHELNVERELTQINTMLKTQYDHYRNYQQNIDLINFKYHDLKHQIAGLKAEMSEEKRNAWIDTLEEELDSYRPETQTGNQVLDGILDAKMAMIRNNQIKFTCVADGEKLNFMHVTDICTIFGNALDNALESTVQVPDPEKRMIHLSVSAKKQFLAIQVQNYCEQPVKFVNGAPATSKKDTAMHGFGTKSIAFTAEKYGGNVSYSLEQKFFNVNILIPLPVEEI